MFKCFLNVGDVQMGMQKLDFFQEVQVGTYCLNKLYHGKKGVVLGISEEDGVVYGYAVLIHGADETVYFDMKDLTPTGKMFLREDFY